ncbi:MAG TPA: SDR family oxidoreductase [Lysobacter sp.]|nr:SDR family oxidoreductase [Lysobacter sp.]
MRVLVIGASGLIGSALVDALRAAGHDVAVGVRRVEAARVQWPGLRVVGVDFARDQAAVDWVGRLQGVDAVVNVVGLIREHGAVSFEAVHVRAPRALFEACVLAGVKRVVQFSALGADAGARTGYHRSKRDADDALRALPLHATVLQPSLVFAPHGTSARWFLMLASLPLIPLPGRAGALQPVHLDDVCAAVVALLARDAVPATLAVVGPRPLSLRDYLAALRQALGLGRARFLPVPGALARVAAAVGARLPGSLLSADTLSMLERGNTADVAPLAALLGRAPRPVEAFVPPAIAPALRDRARLRWLLPVLRGSLALVWIVTALLSFGLYPVEASRALLARTGLTGSAADVALYGAAALDLALGLATLFAPRRRALYALQAALIAGYTVIITIALPEFWLHPYGPVLKNVPLLAMLWLLWELDRPEAR